MNKSWKMNCSIKQGKYNERWRKEAQTKGESGTKRKEEGIRGGGEGRVGILQRAKRVGEEMRRNEKKTEKENGGNGAKEKRMVTAEGEKDGRGRGEVRERRVKRESDG